MSLQTMNAVNLNNNFTKLEIPKQSMSQNTSIYFRYSNVIFLLFFVVLIIFLKYLYNDCNISNIVFFLSILFCLFVPLYLHIRIMYKNIKQSVTPQFSKLKTLNICNDILLLLCFATLIFYSCVFVMMNEDKKNFQILNLIEEIVGYIFMDLSATICILWFINITLYYKLIHKSHI